MSPDEASLLRAVLAAPDADEPRLAYADRLAESSRTSDQAHAEFIRLQIELAQLPDEDSRWPTLIGRERELLARYRTGWERPLRDRFKPRLASPGRWLRTQLFGNGGRWGFRRGFVEHILAAAPRFLAEDAAVLDHTPIRRIVLAHASDFIRPLAAEPHLNALSSLHLVGDMELDEDLNLLTSRTGPRRCASSSSDSLACGRTWKISSRRFEPRATRKGRPVRKVIRPGRSLMTRPGNG